MRPASTLLLLLCAASLLVAGCLQPTPTPTTSATPTPTPIASPTVTASPSPTAKACSRPTDCRLATAQVARYCNGTDGNAWSTETRFDCVQGKCSDSTYVTTNALLESCASGCTNGFCNQPSPTPTPSATPTPDSLALTRARITRLAGSLGSAAGVALGQNVTLQGSPDSGYTFISSSYSFPTFSLNVAQYAYSTYAPPYTTGYNPYLLTSGNLSKEVDFLQDPGNCRSGLSTCRQKIRMQCYSFSIMTTIEVTEDTSNSTPQGLGLRLAQQFLASCPNEFNAP